MRAGGGLVGCLRRRGGGRMAASGVARRHSDEEHLAHPALAEQPGDSQVLQRGRRWRDRLPRQVLRGGAWQESLADDLVGRREDDEPLRARQQKQAQPGARRDERVAHGGGGERADVRAGAEELRRVIIAHAHRRASVAPREASDGHVRRRRHHREAAYGAVFNQKHSYGRLSDALEHIARLCLDDDKRLHQLVALLRGGEGRAQRGVSRRHSRRQRRSLLRRPAVGKLAPPPAKQLRNQPSRKPKQAAAGLVCSHQRLPLRWRRRDPSTAASTARVVLPAASRLVVAGRRCSPPRLGLRRRRLVVGRLLLVLVVQLADEVAWLQAHRGLGGEPRARVHCGDAAVDGGQPRRREAHAGAVPPRGARGGQRRIVVLALPLLLPPLSTDALEPAAAHEVEPIPLLSLPQQLRGGQHGDMLQRGGEHGDLRVGERLQLRHAAQRAARRVVAHFRLREERQLEGGAGEVPQRARLLAADPRVGVRAA
mmetsp:Transcript_43920/g.106670  ORF Transcript_43920/g.106670 Transcript_43920/m.106670 type:complete len:483 (-) Transcript_43920:600-2048(-)